MIFLLLVAALSPTAVDRHLAPLVAAHDFSGVVLIARGNRVLVQRSYGKADAELGTGFPPGARFRIASITKTFTGAAIAMLAERGQLAFTDPLAKFLPDFPNAGRILLRHLLLHTSGVPNPQSETCGDATLDDLVAELAKKPLDFEPGTKGRYSNGGFALLAKVVERASGMSWGKFIQTQIAAPLNLSGTGPDRAAALVPGRVHGYLPGPPPSGLMRAPCDGSWAAIGSGALLSTAGDLHRWAKAVRDEKLFKRGALEHPYGWGVRKYFDRNAIEQSGILGGASSYLAAYLEEDLYVVVLSNVQTGALDSVGKGLAALALGATPPPLPLAPREVAAGDLSPWMGRFAGPDFGFELFQREGLLYLRWKGARDAVYLSPAGADTAYDRQDSIALRRSEGGVQLTWPGAPPQEFKREP